MRRRRHDPPAAWWLRLSSWCLRQAWCRALVLSSTCIRASRFRMRSVMQGGCDLCAYRHKYRKSDVHKQLALIGDGTDVVTVWAGEHSAGTRAHWRAVPGKSAYFFAKSGSSYHEFRKVYVWGGAFGMCPSGVGIGSNRSILRMKREVSMN